LLPTPNTQPSRDDNPGRIETGVRFLGFGVWEKDVVILMQKNRYIRFCDDFELDSLFLNPVKDYAFLNGRRLSSLKLR